MYDSTIRLRWASWDIFPLLVLVLVLVFVMEWFGRQVVWVGQSAWKGGGVLFACNELRTSEILAVEELAA